MKNTLFLFSIYTEQKMEEYFNIIQSELLTGFTVAFQNGKGDLLNPNPNNPS